MKWKWWASDITTYWKYLTTENMTNSQVVVLAYATAVNMLLQMRYLLLHYLQGPIVSIWSQGDTDSYLSGGNHYFIYTALSYQFQHSSHSVNGSCSNTPSTAPSSNHALSPSVAPSSPTDEPYTMGCDQCQNWVFGNRVHSLIQGHTSQNRPHVFWKGDYVCTEIVGIHSTTCDKGYVFWNRGYTFHHLW